jgi:hypothetical protein
MWIIMAWHHISPALNVKGFKKCYVSRVRGRPRSRWQDEVRVDGKLVGGKRWKERVYNREKMKTLLRTARNCHILHMPKE